MISWDTDVDSSCPTLFGWCRGFAEVSDSNCLDVSGGGALDHNEHPSVAVGLCKLREFVSFRKVGV